MRMALQVLFLLTTMQATATNYFLETPLCGHQMAMSQNLPTTMAWNRTTCGYHTCNTTPNIVEDPKCEFFVTTAVIQQDGSYEICVEPNFAFPQQYWEVLNEFGPGIIATSSDPSPCWTFPDTYGPGFTIRHIVFVGEGTDSVVCSNYIYLVPDTLCPVDIVTARVLNCHLETIINIDVSAITSPFVIDFGDGSPLVQSSATEIGHIYSVPGTYNVCLTFPYGEVGVITCCYPIEVELPEPCICPETFVYLASVEPCTWAANMFFTLNFNNFPIEVDYGDNTTETVDDVWVLHNYPGPGLYNVCYTREVFPGSSITCCQQVNIPGCCLDPSFQLQQLAMENSPSCLNPLYRISDIACSGSVLFVEHTWEFSDGTVYYGIAPDPHLFTNFVDADGEICVTHTITCCEESASATVCLPHLSGAWLGQPGQSLAFSETLPFTGETVLEFIYDNASGSLPFIVDCHLIANKAATFNGGVWNMARESEVEVRGGTGKVLDFILNGTTLRSAVRLPGSPPCCRWKGVWSWNLTNIGLNGALITDAKYAIRYPSGGAGDASFPALSSVNSQYINNYYGIKSESKYVNFHAFSGNEMEGAQMDPHVCGCEAVNAIDFRHVDQANTLLPIKIAPSANGTNTIYHYEKAFNFVNTNLFVRGFDIHSLKDFTDPPGVPNNGPGLDDAAIGIDFQWSKSTKSSLDLDRMKFYDFMGLDTRSVAVRENITGGKHALRAIASQPHASITTYNVAGGYELHVGPAGLISGEIKQNKVHTNGTYYGFGINGNLVSQGNTLKVLNNQFNIGSNTTNTLMNGGIMLASPSEVSQNYTIVDNTIDVLTPVGAGIGITNTRGFIIRRNTLADGYVGIPGIQLNDSGSGLVDCNNVRLKRIGVDVNSSDGVRYADNFFSQNVQNDIKFGTGVNNSEIKWNFFRGSGGPSLLYDATAVTGQQHHTNYNQWEWRNGVEVQHGTGVSSPQAVLCRFWKPNGHTSNTIMHPQSNPALLLFTDAPLGAPIDSFPTPLNFCTDIHDTFDEFTDPDPDPAASWASIVQDTSTWSGLTAAEQNFMRQEIYGPMLANPSWISSSIVLSGFKTAQEAGFVGQVEALRQDWQHLTASVSAHKLSLEPTYIALDSLAGKAQVWLDAMSADTTLRDSLQPLFDAALFQSDSLSMLLWLTDSLYYLSVVDTVTLLLSQNALLEEDSLYTWYEKRYNEIALNWLAGTEPDSTATADLRQMAQTCLRYGGRAVLGARGLCEVWLNEYYDEDNCNGTLQSRSFDGSAPINLESTPSLHIVPNPAQDMVRISVQDGTGNGQLVRIFSSDGRQVYQGKLTPYGDLEIPVTGWRNGIYIVRVLTGAVAHTRSFVVQHP